jgi:hypothetical protein
MKEIKYSILYTVRTFVFHFITVPVPLWQKVTIPPVPASATLVVFYFLFFWITHRKNWVPGPARRAEVRKGRRRKSNIQFYTL